MDCDKIFSHIRLSVSNNFFLFFLIFVFVFVVMFCFLVELIIAGRVGNLLSGMGTFLIGLSAISTVFFWHKGLKVDLYKKKSSKYEELIYKMKKAAGKVLNLNISVQKGRVLTPNMINEVYGVCIDVHNCIESSYIISEDVKKMAYFVTTELKKMMIVLENNETVSFDFIEKLIRDVEQQVKKEIVFFV